MYDRVRNIMKWPKTIKTFDNSQPHESHGGWKKFLKNHCEVRDKYRGVIFFGATNCNYILFQDGLLICNYGYHGKALMNDLREEGVAVVKKKIITSVKEIRETLKRLKSLDNSLNV